METMDWNPGPQVEVDTLASGESTRQWLPIQFPTELRPKGREGRGFSREGKRWEGKDDRFFLCSHSSIQGCRVASSQPFNFPGLSSTQGGQSPLTLGLPLPWRPGKRERRDWKTSGPLGMKQVHQPCRLQQPGLRKQFKSQELDQGAEKSALGFQYFGAQRAGRAGASRLRSHSQDGK